MAAPRLTSRERRGILAVAAVALLVTGAGVALRLLRPTAPPLPQPSTIPMQAATADTPKVLLPADTASTHSTKEKPLTSSPSTRKTEKVPRKKAANKKPPRPAPASPLDRPVKTL